MDGTQAVLCPGILMIPNGNPGRGCALPSQDSCWHLADTYAGGWELGRRSERKEGGKDYWQILPWCGNRMQPYDEPEPWELGGPLSRHHLWADTPVRCIRHTFPTRGCWNSSSSLMASKDSWYMLQLGRDTNAFPQYNKQLKYLLRYLPLLGFQIP